MVDFQACSWPEGLDATSMSLAEHFDQMNQEPVADVVSALAAHEPTTDTQPPVITFSHFLPLQVWPLCDVLWCASFYSRQSGHKAQSS